MINHNHKSQNTKKNGINPVATAITGAVIGAGAIIVSAVALKNKKNRKKITEVLRHVKDQATEYIEDLQKMGEGKKEKIEEKLSKAEVKKDDGAI